MYGNEDIGVETPLHEELPPTKEEVEREKVY